MVLELLSTESYRKEDKDKDKGEEFEIGLENGRVKIEQDKVEEQDPKNTLSYWDSEDLRLYDVFQDTPEIVTEYINKKYKSGYGDATITFKDIKDKASKDDLIRFLKLTDSQFKGNEALRQSFGTVLSPTAVASTGFSPSDQLQDMFDEIDTDSNYNRIYPTLDLDVQKKDNLSYDIYKRKRPLDTTELPWYVQKGIAFQSGLSKGTLGLTELLAGSVDVAAGIASEATDYKFDPNFLIKVQKATEEIDVNSGTFTNKLFDIAGQFVIPFGVANKFLNGIRAVKSFKKGDALNDFLLRRFGWKTPKLPEFKIPYSKIPLLKLADKTYNTSKIASRTAHYGGLAFGVDALVATNQNHTFGDYFGGPTEREDLEGLTGKERAIANFKNKLKFGVEGAVGFGVASTALRPVINIGAWGVAKTLGGAIRTLDFALAIPRKIAGTEVVVGGTRKYLTKEAGKKKWLSLSVPKIEKIPFLDPTGKITQSINRFLNSAEVVEGGIKYGFLVKPDLLKNGMDVIAKLLKKRGVPKFEDWQAIHRGADTFPQRAMKRLSDAVGMFTSAQYLPRRFFDFGKEALGVSRGKQARANKIWDDIKREIDKLANSKKFDDFAGTTSQSRFNMIAKDMVDYMTVIKILVISNFHGLPKEIIPDIIKLKNRMEDYAKSIAPLSSKKEVVAELSKDFKHFITDNYRLFGDKKYVPLAEASKKMQAYIRLQLQKQALDNGEKLTRNKKIALAKEANVILNSIQHHLKGANFGGNVKKAITEMMKKFTDHGLPQPGFLLKPGQKFTHNVVRDWMGRIKDPRNLYMEVLAKIADSAAMKIQHAKILKDGLGKWIFKTEADFARAMAARNVSAAAEEIVFKEGAYGFKSPLEGYFTTPDIVSGLKGNALISDVLEKFPGYKTFLAAKALTEFSKTVLSYMTHLRNVLGNTFIALYNGHYGRGASLLDNWQMILRDLFGRSGKSNKETLDDLGEELARWGISDTNVISRQFQYLSEEIYKGRFNTTAQLYKFLTDNQFVKKTTQIYQSEDNLWKAFGYLFTKSSLTRAFKNIPDAQKYFKEQFRQNVDLLNGDGTKKTLGELIQEASAREIRDVYPNYDMIGRLFRELRKVPMVGNFVSFPAEITRNMINGLKYDFRRASSSFPELREQAYRGIFGKMATGSIGYVGVKLSLDMHGMSQEQYADLKEFAYPWDVNADLIMIQTPIIGVDPETGEVKFNKDKLVYGFANSAYHIPQGFMFAPINAMVNSFMTDDGRPQSEVFYDSFIGTEEKPGAFREFMDPFMSESIIAERVFDLTIRNGKTKNGKTIVSRLDDPSEAYMKSISHVFQALEPGTFNSMERIFLAGEGAKLGKKELDLQWELLKLLTGFGVTTLDISNAFDFETSQFGRDLGEARAGFFRIAGKPRIETSVFGTVPVTRDQRTQEYFDMHLKQYELMSKFNKKQKSANNLGLDYDMQEDILMPGGKPKSGLRKDLIDGLEDNIFVPSLELSDDDGSFMGRYAEEYGGTIADHFDVGKMEAIHEFFDQDIPLGHQKKDIIRLWNGEITSLPALPTRQNANEGVEIDMDNEEPTQDSTQGLQLLDLSQAPPQIQKTPITPPQVMAAAPQVVSPAARGTEQGLTPTEMALLSPEEQVIKLRQNRNIV